MTYPNMKPCPRCNSADNLAVYAYKGGARHVERVACDYLGPACTSVLWAIRHYNAANNDERAAYNARQALKGQL